MSHTNEQVARAVAADERFPCDKCGKPVGWGERVDVLLPNNEHAWRHPECHAQGTAAR